METTRTAAREAVENLSDADYTKATRIAESAHGVGLTGLLEAHDFDAVADVLGRLAAEQDATRARGARNVARFVNGFGR